MCSVTLEIQGLNPPGQGDEEDADGFTKTFPDIPCVSQMSGGLCCGSAFSQDGSASRQDREKVGVRLGDW